MSTGRPPAAPTPPAAAAPVHPRTGEVLELTELATDELAAVQVELKAREAEFKGWRELVELELRDRLEQGGRRRAVVGDYEIQIETGRSRVWDPDELEQCCRTLVDAGVLQASELAGLITPAPPKVDGNRARDLLGRLTGQPRTALERCFSWKDGRPRLSVTKSISLFPDPPPDREVTR